MELDVRMIDTNPMDSVRAYVRRRVRFALGRFSRWIRRVTVRVTDINGPRGGVDKECRIAVDLVPTGRIVLTDRGSDLHVAVDRGVDRLRWTVARRVARSRSARVGRAALTTVGRFDDPSGTALRHRGGLSEASGADREALGTEGG